ncbi:hypothetical protein HED60_05515 [Planctomycetales bacterium ZRK34]|nr:hypothetical protein HED60_05515 [Planctomycetales bacterium ZRK34]
MSNEHAKNGNDFTPIIIDNKPYKAPKSPMTGSELRALAVPPIASDYELWLEMPGDDDDKIADNQAVELKPGMHFYSVLGQINPGASDGTL